jgi:hypothetical protein
MPMKHGRVIIERVWWRDGTSNRMSLEAAVDNICQIFPGCDREDVVEALIDGAEFRTPLAKFSRIRGYGPLDNRWKPHSVGKTIAKSLRRRRKWR